MNEADSQRKKSKHMGGETYPDIGERLRMIRIESGLNLEKMAELGKVSRRTLGKVEKGEAAPPISLVIAARKELGFEYAYIFGDTTERHPQPATLPIGAEQAIPYYDIDVTAGPVEVFSDYTEQPSSYVQAPNLNDCDFAVPVYGDSMYEKYRSGDIIVCKEVHDRSVILYGEVYLVVTNGFRTIKYLRKAEQPQQIILAPENKNYDPVEIARDDILKLYIVKGKIERKFL